MLDNNHFYHQLTRKAVILMGRLFDDITIIRKNDQTGKETQALTYLTQLADKIVQNERVSTLQNTATQTISLTLRGGENAIPQVNTLFDTLNGIIVNGVDVRSVQDTQNTNITAVNNYAASAYSKANTSNNTLLLTTKLIATSSNSYSFDGSSYLTSPDSAEFSFGTGDFTVEGWVYATSSVFDANNPNFSSVMPFAYGNYITGSNSNNLYFLYSFSVLK